MAIDSKISIFTDVMRTEFNKAYEAVAVPAEFAKYTTIVPSTARIEHYTWMSPSPGISLYRGHRRFGKISTIVYNVENLEFDSSFEVLQRDVEDDQTGGYLLKPKELAERAAVFPSRWTLKTLGLAALQSPTAPVGFDGTNFFADSHSIGTGDNNLAYTSTGTSDGKNYTLVALYHGSILKPLIWQNRKGPRFRTDSGTPNSDMDKSIKYWIDMEGQAAFGYWWNAVYVYITNTPSVADIQIIFGNVTKAFRTYLLPKSLTSDDGEYIHEQTKFSAGNLMWVGSPGLERLLAQALGEDWIPQNIGSNTVATTNLFKGYGDYVVSNYLYENS